MLDQLLSALPLPAFCCDDAGVVTRCNDKAMQLWGQAPRHDVVGHRFCGPLQPCGADGAMLPREECCIAEALREGRSRQDVLYVSRELLGVQGYQASIEMLRDDGGKVHGALTVLHELPAVVEPARDLRWLQSVVDSLADGVIVAGVDGTLHYWNPAALRLHGFVDVAEVQRHLATFTRTFEMTTVAGAVVPFEDWPMARMMRGEEVRNYELNVHRRDIGKSWRIRYDGGVAADPSDGRKLLVLSLQDLTVRRQAQAELQRTTNLLRAVVDGTTDAVFVKDRDGRYLMINEAGAGFMGRPVAELIDHLDAEFLPADSAARVRARDMEVIATGEARTYEEHLVLDGVAKVFFAAKAPYRDETGAVIGLIGVSRDITERQRDEQRLRDSEERYRRLLDVLPDAVFVDSGGEVVFCNPAFLRLVGAEQPEQVLGRQALSFFPPETHATIRAGIERMLATCAPAPPMTQRVLRLDGGSVPVSVVATPIVDRGRPAILVAMNDLTERERSMELMRSVQASVSDAILTIDEYGVILSANQATRPLFGIEPEALIGTNVSQLMPEPHRREHDSYLERYLRTGNGTILGNRRELDACRSDGSTFPIELTVTEFTMDGRRHFTGVIRDISQRKALEAQLLQAQKMDAIGRLAGGVAHDFNNLLTVINGHCELLLGRQKPDDPCRNDVRVIHGMGQRAERLTRQLLTFSRKAVMASEVIDLNGLVSESEQMLQRLIGEDIQLQVSLAPEVMSVRVATGLLEQVLMNLVVNARDAMPTGGRIDISTMPFERSGDSLEPAFLLPGHYVELRVHDTGQGMSTRVKASAFEPFFTTKSVGKGSGLGLAVVHGVVHQAGGQVVIDSAEGKGTTVRMWLPRVDSELPAVPAQEAPIPRGSETVLLVEDEDVVRDIVLRSLELFGYTVIEANSGKQALELVAARGGAIDLLVTDVIMPGMNGSQLANQLRERLPGLRVLFVSGYTEDAVLRHGVATATEAFLSKPFTPRALAVKIRGVLDARR